MADNEMMTGFLAGKADNDNRDNGMWGGDGWWAIILFAMIFGWGRNGMWGGNEAAALNGALTRADLCEGFNFNDLQSGVRGVQQGLCDSTYALNSSIMGGFHGVDNAICSLGYQTQQGFAGVDRAVCDLGYRIQDGQNQLSRQMADCCCTTDRLIERGFCDTNYNLASSTREIVQNAHNDADRVIAKLCDMETARQQEKIEALRTENQSLKFAAYANASQDAQTAELVRRIAPMPVPSYTVPAPYPYGYGRGCGDHCGCGCGC